MIKACIFWHINQDVRTYADVEDNILIFLASFSIELCMIPAKDKKVRCLLEHWDLNLTRRRIRLCGGRSTMQLTHGYFFWDMFLDSPSTPMSLGAWEQHGCRLSELGCNDTLCPPIGEQRDPRSGNFWLPQRQVRINVLPSLSQPSRHDPS